MTATAPQTTTPGGDLDLGAKTSAAWATLRHHLAAVLRDLPADTFLVLVMDAAGRDVPGVARPQYFVQFGVEDDRRMVSEAVGNAHLPDQHRLDATAVERMATLGWADPTDAHTGNFWQEWPAPVAYDEVAALAVRTLTEVYGAPHPAFLRYTAGRREDAAPIGLPQLGLLEERDGGLAQEMPDGDLNAHVNWAVGRWLGSGVVKHDEDGDIPIRTGSAIVFVRTYDRPPLVEVFSPLVAGVADTPDVLRRVNRLTCELPLVRFAVLKDVLVVSVQVLGEPFTPEHLETALDLVSQLGDRLDDELAREFGGRVFFSETLPERRESGMVEGYL